MSTGVTHALEYRGFGTTYVLRTSSITYMSWKVPILALESYCHGQKVGYLSQFKEEKIQLPLGVRGAKAAALFSIFGTGKYSNFKIIV